MRIWTIDQLILKNRTNGDKIILTEINCIKLPIEYFVSSFELWRRAKIEEVMSNNHNGCGEDIDDK